MKSKRLTLSVLFVAVAVVNALACTNLIVGKNASTDGSTKQFARHISARARLRLA